MNVRRTATWAAGLAILLAAGLTALPHPVNAQHGFIGRDPNVHLSFSQNFAFAKQNIPYAQTAFATGGTPPYTFSITSGTLLDAAPWVSARSAGTSFTVTVNAAPSTNPECFSYRIVN